MASQNSFRERLVFPAAILGTAALPALIIVLIRERLRRIQAEKEALDQQEAAARSTRLRDEERRGRIRAEQQLRGAAVPSSIGDENTEQAAAIGNEDGFVFHPIGTFRSCYRNRCGTPRQGGVVPESLAVLSCAKDLNPAAALDGIEEFSHCWVLYVFHENTNLQREGRTVANRRNQKKGRVPLWQGLCMKVAPPRCPDADLRVGVLACRTPHRPNPVGLSLARIVKVDKKKGEIVFGGLDVVDGTPCLDLKPYLPGFECQPSATVPTWVQASHDEPLMEVSWASEALASFNAMFGNAAMNSSQPCRKINVKPFACTADLRSALEGTLALDVRSPVQRGRHPNPVNSKDATAKALSEPFFIGDLWFHELHVTYALLPVEARASGEAAASVRIERVEARSDQSQDSATEHI